MKPSIFVLACVCAGLSLQPLLAEEAVKPATTESRPAAKIEDITIKMSTTKGDISLKLFATKTPMTVASFLNLAKQGFYDGLTFHRVIADFMIQGGDPTGTGRGGPGYRFDDEFNAELRHNKAGILSMANAGPGTNGSQFFITHGPTPHLDGRHSVFGEVINGIEVVNQIQMGDKIKKIEIVAGNPEGLFAEQKANIEKWNAAIKAAKQ